MLPVMLMEIGKEQRYGSDKKMGANYYLRCGKCVERDVNL